MQTLLAILYGTLHLHRLAKTIGGRDSRHQTDSPTRYLPPSTVLRHLTKCMTTFD